MENNTALGKFNSLQNACNVAANGYGRIMAVVLGEMEGETPVYLVTTWKVAGRLERKGMEVMLPIDVQNIARRSSCNA
jgi:hypothetical protein